MIWECLANGHPVTYYAQSTFDACMFMLNLYKGGTKISGWKCIDRSGQRPAGEGCFLIPGWHSAPPEESRASGNQSRDKAAEDSTSSGGD